MKPRPNLSGFQGLRRRPAQLAISCLDRNIIYQSMIKIHVKSQVLDWMGEESTSTIRRHQALGREEDGAPESKRRRAVRFVDDEVFNSPAVTKLPLGPRMLDLRVSHHFCSQLTPKHLHHHNTASETRCVGFLDTSSHDRFRHEFFNRCEGFCSPAIC